jgi:UDP-N-acetylglucosamine 3-dehydrogenase
VTLRAAVVGTGMMGRHHVRILGQMAGVDLVAVVDANAERAAKAAAAVGATPYSSVADLGEVDLAVVAVPTPGHLSVALELIERGVHVLVEKPLAPSPAEALRIVDAASKAGVVLAVGHVERFNPAVMALAKLVVEPLHMQFERLSPFTPRVGDSVVFDLMVHDLDLACLLAGCEPTGVEAGGVRVFSDTIDIATAVLRYPTGTIATLTASRATQDKIRRISVSERDRFSLADCLRQDVQIRRETVSEFLDDDGGTYRQASVTEIPYLDRRAEPLAAELRDFVEAVRGEHAPSVDGHAGWLAVDLARRVEAAAGA